MLASNLVHEVAHQKLFALGVLKESSTALVENDPSELYDSPVITDRQRPMTAGARAVRLMYYVTQLELEVIEVEPPGSRRERMLQRVAHNVRRLREEGCV